MKDKYLEALRKNDESLIVSNEEIDSAFRGTDFGGHDHRKILNQAVLKKAMQYHCGHTITCIMQELGLIGKNGVPTKKGIHLLRVAYHDLVREGC